MKSTVRTLLICVIAILGGSGLIWGFMAGRSEQSAEAQREAPIEAPSRVRSENGKTVLTFDAQAQQANGIALSSLIENKQNTKVQANGVVLQLQPLLDLKASYNASSLELVKAHAAARASQAEYERLRQLNENGKNASDKAVEAARATAESDAALVQNAEQSLAVLRSSIQLHWGPVVAKWLEQGSAQLDRLLTQRVFLLQVTAFNAASPSGPKQALVEYPDGAHGSAQLISLLPQLDPRLQAPSFLYLVSEHSGLVPGINLAVFLPSDSTQTGVVVPHSAVVWWQGKAWCYVEESPDKFTRKEVPTLNPISNGWFVAEGIVPGAHIVTSGAQTLLSEEFRSQIQLDQD